MAEWALLAAWLVGCLLVAAAPLTIGVVVTLTVPSLEGINHELPLWALLPGLVLDFVVMTFFATPLERLTLMATRAVPHWISKTASEAIGVAFLWALLLPLMADALSAFVAAITSLLVYLLTSPVVDAIEAKRLRK